MHCMLCAVAKTHQPPGERPEGSEALQMGGIGLPAQMYSIRICLLGLLPICRHKLLTLQGCHGQTTAIDRTVWRQRPARPAADHESNVAAKASTPELYLSRQ